MTPAERRILEVLRAAQGRAVRTTTIAGQAGLEVSEIPPLLKQMRREGIILRGRSQGIHQFLWRLRPGGPGDGQPIE